jgi:hypothetical protein
MMHLGGVTELASWVTSIKHGSEHRGFVPLIMSSITI